MAVWINDQLKKTMQNSMERVQNREPMQRAALRSRAAQTAPKPAERIGQKSSNAYQKLKTISTKQSTPRVDTGWQYRADGTRKSFSELTTPEVLTWISTLPDEERGSAAREFETNYLKNPGSTLYDPYYTDYSNNDEARSLFGVNVFDQKWIDANRGYANYLTFSGENYTSPKKPGANASEEEKRAYQWWQIANTYEQTTQAAESEYSQLRSEIQEMVKISRKAGDRLTADEILQGIDWGEYKTLENLREASAAGNGRYLNRPVQVGDASLKSMVNAALRGEDITDARDFVYDESEFLRTGAARSKYMLPIEETVSAAEPENKSPYADVTSADYDPYFGEGSNNARARELFGVDSFDQEWIDKNRNLLAYIQFKDEDDTEPIKPDEDASEQEKAAYEYWKIANTYEATTQEAEKELESIRSRMEKKAGNLGEDATADDLMGILDWEDEDFQKEYPTLYKMREVAAAGNARMVNRQVGAGEASLRQMAESILGGKEDEEKEEDEGGGILPSADGKPQANAEEPEEAPLTEQRNAQTEKEIQRLQTRMGGLKRAIEIGRLSEEKQTEYEAEISEIEKQLYGEKAEPDKPADVKQEQPATDAAGSASGSETVSSEPKTTSQLVEESKAEYGITGAANQLKVTINYLNGLEAQGQLTDELRAKRDEWQAEYDRLMDDVAERKEIEERVEAEAREESVDKVVAPLRFLWNRGWTDALRDGQTVPTEDYEEFLRYRANPAAAANAEEMAKYDRYSEAGERLSLLAEGYATGMDKAATAVTGGLEHVLYTIARWDPATKGMTKDEVYASDRMLAALKGWNEQYDKQYISEEKKAELTEQYPVVSLVSTGVSEMLKMMGQAGGALPFDPTGAASAVTQYGLNALQTGGAALRTLGRMGEKAVHTMPFALDVYGSTYETAISEGATENQAAGAAALNGLLTGSISNWITGRLGKLGGNIARLFGSRAGQKAAQQGAIAAAKNGTSNAIIAIGKQLLESAVEEGAEEALEVPIENIFAKAVYDNDRAWTGEGGVFDAKAMMESGIGGAVAGSMFTITAGASGLMGRPAKAAADQIIEKAENGEKIEQSEIDELEKIEAREAAIQDKTEEIMKSDTSAIDAAEAKVEAAEKTVQEAEVKLQETEAQAEEAKEEARPIVRELNEGTKSLSDPEVKKAIAESNQQVKDMLEASQAQVNAVETAKQEYAQMMADRDETIQQAQEAAREQATQEVEAELQTEREAEAQALADVQKAEAEREDEPGMKWMATKKIEQLKPEQRTQINILNELGKQYGVEIDIVDTLGPGKNGLYGGGRRVTVALDATESAYVQVGVHEMVHYVRGMDEAAYGVLEEVVMRRMKDEGIDFDTLVRQRMKEYEGTQALSEAGAREEIIAETVPQVLTNEESARRLVQENQTLAQKIRDFFIDFAKKIKSIGERYAARNDRGEATLFHDNTEALMEIAGVLDNALTKAGRAGINQDSFSIKYSKGEEKSSIRDQIGFHQEELNVLEPVADYVSDAPETTNRTEIINWAMEKLADTGYKVEREGFGTIEFGRKRIKAGLSYLSSHEEVAAFAAVPDVLRNGIIANQRGDHKGRQYDTITFAAPVVINGQRGNMAVAVIRTEGNHYRAHRILMPDGSTFEFEQKKNTEDGSYRGLGEDATHAGSTNSVSDSSIPDYSENVNGKFSLKSDEETDQLIEDVKAEEKGEAMDDAARVAHRTIKAYKSTLGRSEAAAEIDQMIDAYQAHDDGKAAEIADRLAKKVIEASLETDTRHREGYEEIRKRLRMAGFSLTDTQKQEVASRFGSYNDWRRSIMGSVKIKNDAGSLDSIWSELSGMHPEYFPADANEAQMPEYIEEFVRAMKPKYTNRYGMDAATAAADLSTQLQADVMEALGRNETAQKLRNDSETFREQARLQTEEKRAKAREKRAQQFGEIAQRIKAGRDAGNDTEIQNALNDYRRMMGGRSHAADAIDAGIESRRLRKEIRRITGIIEQYGEMVNGEDTDFDRGALNNQKESYIELRDQLQRQQAALQRQEVLERAAIPDDETDADAEELLAGEMQKRMDEDMAETISERVVEMRGRVKGLWERMKGRMKDFNMTSTISKADLAETFRDLEGEIVQHSELSRVWERRQAEYAEQLFTENNELTYLRNEQKRAKGDQASTATLSELILEAQDRVNVLESQVKNAKAQAEYCRRIGAESLEKAFSEGKLPEPIMERVIALCRDAGRRGALNQNALIKAGEAIRLNTTTAARVYDDLFGEAAPLMRAIYYDPVMDNETDRQRWIKQWRERIGALKLTKEQSALVQEIGEGRLDEQDARYQQADQKVHDAVKVFREFYDEAHAMATRALVRNGYERPGRITDYFPHIETQKTFWDKLGIPIENTSLPTSINGLTETFTPGRQYSGHLEHRYGEKTDYDALFGFEQYISGISNVIYHTDDIQRHRQLETEIRTAAKRGLFEGGQRSEHLSEFVKWIHEYTNLLAGKKSWVDRPFEGTAGRAIYSAATRLKNMKGASAVCGNIASAVTNMVPVIQVLTEVPLATVKGAAQMLMGVSNGRGNIPESQYKIRKLGSDSVVETMYTRFTHYASKPFELVDLLATNIVVNAYYQDNLQKGMDSETAMRSADSKAARRMGDRSKGAMPNIYGSQILGFVTQFQLEIANQSQYYRKDIWRTGSAKKAMITLLASALTGHIWNEFNEWLTGRRPAADPFQIGIDVYNTWKNDGSPMEIGQAAYNGLSEMLPYANMGGRPAAFDGIGTFIEALTTEGNDGEDVLYAMKQLGYSMVPGGGQLKKTIAGFKAINEGGYYNASGSQLRYAVPSWDEDPLTALQAVIFGPSSTKAARDYYSGDASGLTKTQTEAFEQARDRGATSTEAYRNEADKAAAARIESNISKTENAIEDAEAQARAGEDAPEIDASQLESQREEAAKLRSEATPGDMLTDFWWERKDTPQVQAGIQIWRKTGDTWALPYAYTKDKSYTINKQKEILGEGLLPEAEAMYEEGYMEIMEGVDPEKMDETELEELHEMLEDLKTEVNTRMKKLIRERNEG